MHYQIEKARDKGEGKTYWHVWLVSGGGRTKSFRGGFASARKARAYAAELAARDGLAVVEVA